MTIAEKITRAKADFDEVYEAGKQAGGGGGNAEEAFEEGKEAAYDEFWDEFQNNGGDYKQAFASNCWDDKTYNPKNNIVCTVSGESAFSGNTKITSTKVPIEVRGCSANMMFTNCQKLVTIPFVGFYNNTGNSSFAASCFNLENITIDGEIPFGIGFANASKLTDASVQSIIDHLKDLTGQTAAKITFHSNVVAKLTNEQYNQIANKNWYVG